MSNMRADAARALQLVELPDGSSVSYEPLSRQWEHITPAGHDLDGSPLVDGHNITEPLAMCLLSDTDDYYRIFAVDKAEVEGD